MKDLISGLYHIILEFVMWIPCHPLRRLTCKICMCSFDMRSAICRNVDIRTPYKIRIGAFTIINKKCVLDGRGG